MANLTPQQYCYPYFDPDHTFKDQLNELGLKYERELNTHTGNYKPLKIFGANGYELSVNYFSVIMFGDGRELLVWETNEDRIDLLKVTIKDGMFREEKIVIDLSGLLTGSNGSQLGLDKFVTFVRMSNILYCEKSYAENFAIVVVLNGAIEIIPFDEFNLKGGDLGYVWPAIARLDLDTRTLTGQGMRMAEFTVQL